MTFVAITTIIVTIIILRYFYKLFTKNNSYKEVGINKNLEEYNKKRKNMKDSKEKLESLRNKIEKLNVAYEITLKNELSKKEIKSQLQIIQYLFSQ